MHKERRSSILLFLFQRKLLNSSDFWPDDVPIIDDIFDFTALKI